MWIKKKKSFGEEMKRTGKEFLKGIWKGMSPDWKK
jgi:hypothetical protein